MPTFIQPNPRSSILIALTGMLLLALFYSTSIRFGHADVPIARTAEEIQALTVGETAPRFVVQSVDGNNVDFDPRTLERPTILIAFRGGWCPFCNMHLSELRRVIPEIDEMGVDVLFLSGDRPELLYESLKAETQESIDKRHYTILSDANANAAIALGIAFRASDRTISKLRERGDDIDGSSLQLHSVLPVPAVFAVNSDGIIEYAYANADYKIRVSPDAVLQAAKRLVAKSPGS